MNHNERIKMFNDVFSLNTGEKVLFLVDVPHSNICDSLQWKNRREMAYSWYRTFKLMGTKKKFSVNFIKYRATGLHNSPIPQEIIDLVKNFNLVIAMTEYSLTASVVPIVKAKGSITRCASMPLVEKRMENTALSADYKLVQKYASAIEKILNKAVGAEILFSTCDKLYIDLRNRKAFYEAGDCTKSGQFINLPSGEAFKAPYEAEPEEKNEFGISRTEGVWPVISHSTPLKYIIKNNQIQDIIGKGKIVDEMKSFFSENKTRKNIAELGIGCNPKAVVTGNPLEDEKAGMHIAYGMSAHLGGKVNSDTHFDVIHAKGCPIEGTELTLINKDGTNTELIRDAALRYELFK